MVQKGKKKSKKQSKVQSKKILIKCGDLIYKFALKVSSDIKTQEMLLGELKEELEVIYNKYLEELSIRLKNISNINISLYEPKDFLFQLEDSKVKELQSKVKKFIKGECIKPIYNLFYITIHKFLADIKQEIIKYEAFPREFMILCLAEVLNSLECSAKELGKITENMPEHLEIETNCENITKLAFYEKILKNYDELLISYSKKTTNLIVQNMINLLMELIKGKLNKDIYKISSDISQKSIEEIMSFIDGDEKKKKKNQKKKNMLMNVLDEEIEKFKKVLDNHEGRCVKLKPNVSNDWISSLKLRLKNNRIS